MPDKEVSFYPVRVSAAGAIAKLLEVGLDQICWIVS